MISNGQGTTSGHSETRDIAPAGSGAIGITAPKASDKPAHEQIAAFIGKGRAEARAGRKGQNTLRDDRPPAERAVSVREFELGFLQLRPSGTIVMVARDIARIFSPTSLAGAKPVEYVVRRNAAEAARSYAQVVHAFQDMRDALARLPVEEQQAFTDRMERGEQQPTPALQDVADTLRKTYDEWRDKVRSLGRGYRSEVRPGVVSSAPS